MQFRLTFFALECKIQIEEYNETNIVFFSANQIVFFV